MKLIGLALALCLLAISGNAFADAKLIQPLPGRILNHTSPLNPHCGTTTVRLTRLPVHTGK